MEIDRSRLVGVGVALAVGAAVLVFWPRQQETPEDVIRQKVQAMAAAAGERDVATIMDGISDRFAGRNGTKKDQIKGIIVAQIFRGAWVEVVPMDLEVTLESDTAAEFAGKFVFARKAGEDLRAAAEAGGLTAYRIDGKLEKESDGEWRFVTADYGTADAADLF